MGNAQTTNTINNISNILTTETVNNIQSQSGKQIQSQGIVVEGTDIDGKIIISNNKMSQSGTITMESLLKATQSQQAQQEIMQKLSQLAESTNKQLNLMQNAESSNKLNNVINATIKVSSNTLQSCASTQTQNQNILVEQSKAKELIITDNGFQQIIQAFSKCIENSSSIQTTTQSLSTTLEQTAKATNSGVSPWALVALAFIGLLVLALPMIEVIWGATSVISVFVKALLQFVFVILLVLGIVFIILYFRLKKKVISNVSNKTLISELKAQCNGQLIELGKNQSFSDVDSLGKFCLENNYEAFDFVKLKNEINASVVNVYKTVNPQCKNSVSSSPGISFIIIEPPVILSKISNNPADDSVSENQTVLDLSDGNLSYVTKKSDDSDDSDDSELEYVFVANYIAADKYKDTDITFIHGTDISSLNASQFKPNGVTIAIPLITEKVSAQWKVFTSETNYDEKKPPKKYSYMANDQQIVQSGFVEEKRRFDKSILIMSICFIVFGGLATFYQVLQATPKSRQR